MERPNGKTIAAPWHAQFEAFFSRLGRKVDVVIVLDDFRIGPKIGSVWGKYRSDWIQEVHPPFRARPEQPSSQHLHRHQRRAIRGGL